jgi:glycosylphosphatidylinositol transamidase (GPIT) subunit GPI8
MGMLKPPSDNGLASVTLPQLDHTPSSEGVFIFKGKDEIKNFDSAEYVHEAAFMNEIREVRDSGQFKDIIIIVDACFAGSIDSEQYLNGKEQEVPKVDESKLQTNRLFR